jgi:hypothetical protein
MPPVRKIPKPGFIARIKYTCENYFFEDVCRIHGDRDLNKQKHCQIHGA